MTRLRQSRSLDFKPPKWSVAGILVFMIATATAEPNLQTVATIDGIKVFEDHADPSVYYYLLSHRELGEWDNQPAFDFSLNRYIGRRQTGDEDSFLVRGLIQFETEESFGDSSYSALETELRRTANRPIDLRPAPVSRSYNKLVYRTIASDGGDSEAGEIEGGLVTSDRDPDSVDARYAARHQRFTIGLEALDANLLWDSFHANALVLSLAYGWEVRGVIPSDTDDPEESWQTSTLMVADALPIRLSPKTHPKQFVLNELWQNVDAAHSEVAVFCYDFVNVDQADLYYVIVQLRFQTLSGRPYQRAVKFVSGDHRVERVIEFELANELAAGYQYRIIRLFESGERSETEWLSAQERALDVSLTEDQIAVLKGSEIEE